MNWFQQQQVIFVTRYQPKCCAINPIKKPVRIERYVPPGAIRALQQTSTPVACCPTVRGKDIGQCLCKRRG